MVLNSATNAFGLGYFYLFIRSKRTALSLSIFKISKLFERKNQNNISLQHVSHFHANIEQLVATSVGVGTLSFFIGMAIMYLMFRGHEARRTILQYV